MNLAESKATGFQEQLKTEKRLREKAESSASSLQKVVLVASENLSSLKTSHEEEKAALLKHVEEVEG